MGALLLTLSRGFVEVPLGTSKFLRRRVVAPFRETILLLQDIKEAVDARRFHHQLFPMNLNYEEGITTVSFGDDGGITKSY